MTYMICLGLGEDIILSKWDLLCNIIKDRDPKRIGINTGSTQWAAGGLTLNLYNQLLEHIPDKNIDRLESAEPVSTKWLSTLIDVEIVYYNYIVRIAHNIIEQCYSHNAIVPGITTTEDLEWYYWQICAVLGLDLAFNPFFNIVRSDEMVKRYGGERQYDSSRRSNSL